MAKINYQTIIGLEVHIQSKTESKMFCFCPTDYFGKEPNTFTCPTCLGLPGALPTINKKAIDQCIKLSLALGCKINQKTKFDRKNYFYPDLPKGYQISQFDLPIGEKGFLELDVDNDGKRIRILRVHQEEDTGKSHHEGDHMLLDYNKSGIPLIEVVTLPDFTTKAEVIEFAKELQRIVRYLEVSDADMEKGQMRFELNISLKSPRENGLPDYKVEVKNIGSISVLEKVIDFETKRQADLLDKNKKPKQETRGLKDMSGVTLSQRSKEGSSDYRYFPEPDLPPLEINGKWIERISESIPELPATKRKRMMRLYGLEKDVVKIITDSKRQADYFDQITKGESKEVVQEVSKWFIGEFMRLMNKTDSSLDKVILKKKHFLEIVELHAGGKISGTVAKQVFEEAFKTGESPQKLVEQKGLKQINDEDALEEILNKIVKDFPEQVKQFVSGKDPVMQFLVGQVMRETKGKANPQKAEEMLREKLK